MLIDAHFRKWLPSIRKLSHGKERSQSIGGHDSRHLQKQPSKTKFKVSADYTIVYRQFGNI